MLTDDKLSMRKKSNNKNTIRIQTDKKTGKKVLSKIIQGRFLKKQEKFMFFLIFI